MRACLLVTLALCGCTGGGSPSFGIQLVDENGGRPTEGSGTLTVTVLQEGATAPLVGLAAVSAGAFTLDLAIPSYEPISVVHAELEADAPLLGASTPFRPAFSPGGFARVVMGPPTGCVLLGAPSLDRGRRSPGLALVEANLVVLGGELADGEGVAAVDVLVPHQLTDDTYQSTLDTLSPPLGAVRLVPFAGTTQLLAVGEGGALRFETAANVSGSRATPQTLHPGAGGFSALADLGARGVAVVGGRSGDAAVADVSVVRATGAPERLLLGAPRSGASASAFGGGLLVAGGQAEGAPLFEWVGADGTRAAFGATTARRDGTLVRSPDGATALYYLGVDGSGAAAAGSWIVRGCPGACEAIEGPMATPRSGAVSVARTTGTLVLGGQRDGVPVAQTEEVRFTGGAPSLVAMGPLRSARRGLTAIALWSDVILVGGGEGVEGTLLDSLELCLPERLPAISVP